MKHLTILFALIGLATAAHAADIEAGKAKAATCAACHGPAGISSNPEWPNLAGQQEAYLQKQVTAFRDGDRVDPLMAPMVKPLTDEDIKNIAAYYTNLKPWDVPRHDSK
ncbi:MAG: cytochrome c [Pseudomonadales bacterium]|nr:cytochrome c [Pseudomonadales bacterium]MBL6813741.1 cytochrome c [Pseudomonadales bacterium]